jgi:hypothetical protein
MLAGKHVEVVRNAIEELEATARLAILMHGHWPRSVTQAQIRDVVTTFY